MERRRARIELGGVVQGVGFRPYVYRLANSLGLRGWIANDAQGVVIEVEGTPDIIVSFVRRLPEEAPPHAEVHRLAQSWIDEKAPGAPTGLRGAPAGIAGEGFTIRASDRSGDTTALVLPDLGTCPACLREVLDSRDRRHRYPFTNCTACGPRFSIIRALPYDRPDTTMAGFSMCSRCRAEYEDPCDRRFHAQPDACAECGPRLALWDARGATRARGEEALAGAVSALRAGQVVAVKGLGGFHLMADAADAGAVARLRRSKERRHKPFALMVGDLAQARGICHVDDDAARVLDSPQAPILLLPRRDRRDGGPGAGRGPAGAPAAGEAPVIAPNVAPDAACLGVMLPSTPLHHLMLRGVGRPVVATSGNLRDEPICTDEMEAVQRLAGVADLFLVHDRPIERHVDDSVAWMAEGAVRLLRRARGYAPLGIALKPEALANARSPGLLPDLIGTGAHLKSAVALSRGDRIVIGQHIGDLETPLAMEAFERCVADLVRLHQARPVAVAHDSHPDYLSTRWAQSHAARTGVPLIAVQHHHAHLASCLADNGAPGPALGVTWDGTGYGEDGSIWGGEFLLGDAVSVTRVGRLASFLLPGGEAAVREPRRAALALLWEIEGPAALEREDLLPAGTFSAVEREAIGRMLANHINAPATTSAGRLFDALSSLIGLCQTATFEGQAAMKLEWAAGDADQGAYDFPVREPKPAGDARIGAPRTPAPLVLDWAPLVRDLLADRARGTAPDVMAARVMGAMTAGIVRMVRRLAPPRVALTGGCFQNRRLLRDTAAALRREGFEVLLHRQIPPNDGGISAGQVLVGAARLDRPRTGGNDPSRSADAVAGPGA